MLDCRGFTGMLPWSSLYGLNDDAYLYVPRHCLPVLARRVRSHPLHTLALAPPPPATFQGNVPTLPTSAVFIWHSMGVQWYALLFS